MSNAEASQPQSQVFTGNTRLAENLSTPNVFAGCPNQVDEIRTPGHLLDREYTSAIFARAFYFMSNEPGGGLETGYCGHHHEPAAGFGAATG